ncbi:MAG TPA: SHOCT domain-containing protein [Methanomassiliicoccales archaeon]|nr:SHOCT domain-containing protein [Methanomassiliicoccales archaeon]
MERGKELLVQTVKKADAMWDVKSDWLMQTHDRLVREVSECPLAGAAVSPCDQIESFWKGACSVVAPEWHPKYERKMTTGAERCALVFERIASASSLTDEQKASIDPLESLKLRYAKGEITREQYREMRETLLVR